MRSRSSVLAHILGSNSGICGYSEQHRSYARYTDFAKMRMHLHHELGSGLRSKYLLDKILHNEYEISGQALRAASPKVIFLLRDAGSTIRSIIDMGQTLGIESYADPREATDYYCSRLSQLTDYAGHCRGNCSFVESDDLVENTNQVLTNLTTWLDLDRPLSNDYKAFDNTGKLGHGDPSDNIRAGSLIRTKGHPEIEIPSHLLQAAESAYVDCKAFLSRAGGKSSSPASA